MMKQILGKNDSKTVQEILGKNVEVFWQNVQQMLKQILGNNDNKTI